jgi:phasin
MSETTQTNPTNPTRASRAARAAASVVEENMERAAETLRTEVPSSFVDLFDKTLARTKDMHEKMTSVFAHSTEAFEEAFSCANRGSNEYRNKLMEIARLNANSAFDLAREMCEVRTLPELLELTLDYQRKQFEAASSQLKELSALTQKVVTETTEPIRSGTAEPFKLAS